MFFSLCFLLTIASYGFSGVQSNADFDEYGARSLSSGLQDDAYQRAGKVGSIETVNEGMDKVVSLASALVKGATPTSKRSGSFLAAAKPEIAVDIQKKMKEVQHFAEKMQQSV